MVQLRKALVHTLDIPLAGNKTVHAVIEQSLCEKYVQNSRVCMRDMYFLTGR